MEILKSLTGFGKITRQILEKTKRPNRDPPSFMKADENYRLRQNHAPQLLTNQLQMIAVV